MPVWLWPNILSLDAPVVAVVWQGFLARCYGGPDPSPAARTALFLAVWSIYIADRLIDVRHPVPAAGPDKGQETPRHRFYRENAVFAGVVLALILAGLAIFALQLPVGVIGNGLGVAGLVASYGGVFPWRGARHLKQQSAGLLFSAGVFLVAWSGGAGHRELLVAPALAFGALCLGNMKLVEKRSLGGPGRGLLVAFAVVCLFGASSPWFAAVAASAAALAAIDGLGTALPRDARGVLADLALLTPLLLR